MKCWKHRNECMHNKDKQRKRVVECHRNVISKIVNIEMTELKMYVSRNKIMVIKFMECYVKCWKHRNECIHDENKQRERAIEWCKNANSRIENSEMTQLKCM